MTFFVVTRHGLTRSIPTSLLYSPGTRQLRTRDLQVMVLLADISNTGIVYTLLPGEQQTYMSATIEIRGRETKIIRTVSYEGPIRELIHAFVSVAMSTSLRCGT